MDEGTDAEFKTYADGRITAISVIKGGILSLFGPKTGKGTRIISANASARIRGTTTYFAWQEDHKSTYVCCCYGHLDLENNDSGDITLQTTYHNAVILPPGGGTQPAPMTRRWIIMMTTSRLSRRMRGASRAGYFPAGS